MFKPMTPDEERMILRMCVVMSVVLPFVLFWLQRSASWSNVVHVVLSPIPFLCFGAASWQALRQHARRATWLRAGGTAAAVVITVLSITT